MSSDVLTLPTPAREALAIAGIAHLAVAVTDLARARDFYCGTLGFAPAGGSLAECGEHLLLATASGQLVALCRAASGPSLEKTGVHNAYRVGTAARAAILDRLAAAGTKVFSYKEDRPAEETQNCYFHDPDGNRIQLVLVANAPDSGIAGIDHAATQAIDLEWQEKFYVGLLGLPVDHIVGWRTADYVRAELWAAGKEDMAPGTRRLDKRYFSFPGQPTHRPRPNMQLFVRAGQSVLSLYLATEHFPEPREEQLIGTPRIGLRVARADLDRLAQRLRDEKHPFTGPVRHERGQSIYLKDPGANFLEFCSE